MTFGTFPYLRKPNSELRSREYLTEAEIEKLISAAKEFRHVIRNQTLMLMAYRHALRPGEVVTMRWDQVMMDSCTLHIKSLKNSRPGIHPIKDRELRLLKKLQKENVNNSPYLFQSQKGGHFTLKGFQLLLENLGPVAGIPFKVHPHMFRHSLPTKLSNEGINTATLQAYLRHKNIENTARYINTSTAAFEGFFTN